MKSKITLITTVVCLLFSPIAEAKGFWRKVGNFIGNVSQAAVVVGIDHMYSNYAPEARDQYRQTMQRLNEESEQRAQEHQRVFGVRSSEPEPTNPSATYALASGVGIQQRNIERGIAWTEAQNKYERQNVAGRYVFDAVGEIVGDTVLIRKFRQIYEAQNTYLSENSKAMTTEERHAALEKRNLAYFDIGYDTYEEAQKRRSEHLAEKLKIQQKLTGSGMYADAQLANEVAGSIIAIQRSNLSQQEKRHCCVHTVLVMFNKLYWL